MKYVRDEANNLYEALDAAETVAQITSAVNVEKARAMDAEAEEAALIANKVDKVAGKDLSTNDFTDHYKEVLETLETGAVTGVKGEKESVYKTGQVNLTPEHLGASEAKDTHTNFLDPTLQSTTISGITITNNKNGTYMLNGTSTASSQIILVHYKNYDASDETRLIKHNGKLRFTALPSGAGDANFYAQVAGATSEGAWKGGGGQDIGNGITFTPLENPFYLYVCRLVIPSGKTFSNLLVKPMLTTDLNATYEDFVSFSGNGEINENVAEMYKDKASKQTLATVEYSNTASQAYTVGSYLVYNGQLREVTAAIAAGDTISDSNTAVTNVGAQLVTKQDKEWKQVTFVSGSTTHFYVPAEATEIEVTVLIYAYNTNLSLKFMLTDNDMFDQIMYNGGYDNQTAMMASLTINGNNRIVGANSLRYGDVLATPAVRARWR